MIFVDESIQHDLGYICVGFAYSEDPPDEAINTAILRAGLVPNLDEYKSGARMDNHNARHGLRNDIYRIVLKSCKLGVYIGPISERPTLLTAVVTTVNQIIKRNLIPRPQSVFVDEGILGIHEQSENIVLHTKCDSKFCTGIQLADFVAYHCSYLLKCALTGKQKQVFIEVGPHPLEGHEVSLDWLLRNDFRRHFFVEDRNSDEIHGDDWSFKLAGYGAFFSADLPPGIKAVAEEIFDSMYFGCIW